MKNQNAKMKTGNDIIIEQITADRLDAILAKGTHTIIDVRGPKGIEMQGAIPGAINIPTESIEHALDKNHKDYNPVFNHTDSFLFCCTGGVMSYMAAIKARKKGIKKVYNLEGGHSAWLKLSATRTAI